jgi:hypothetical protein
MEILPEYINQIDTVETINVVYLAINVIKI